MAATWAVWLLCIPPSVTRVVTPFPSGLLSERMSGITYSSLRNLLPQHANGEHWSSLFAQMEILGELAGFSDARDDVNLGRE